MTDPSVADWRTALDLSTSARLRSAELEIEGVREELARQAAANEDLRATLAIRTRDLAASQADLTRMQERWEHLLAEGDDQAVRILTLYSEREEARAEAKEWRAQAEHWLNKTRDTARELAAANYKLSRLIEETK